MEHMDELSDETAEYLLKKMLVLDVKIGPDASRNSMANKEKRQPFSQNVSASDYDVTVLDKAVLSPSGRFLIWYTGTRKSALEDKTAQEWANEIDDIVGNIEGFLDIDWLYNSDKINSDSYEGMKSVLLKCGIDENAMEEAFPIYAFESPKNSNALAWHIRELKFSEKVLFRLGELLNLEKVYGETGTVYSLPYIIVKPSSTSDMDSLNVLLAHELTHQFQRIYYDDLSYNASDFTSETVANFVAACITKIKDAKTITLKNNHANQYMDIVENGKQYLKESLLEEDPFDFLYRKAGDSFQLVLEDLAVRNITKDYEEKAFVSTKYPRPKGKIDRYMDSERSSIHPNCFNYYYLDTKTYSKSESVIHLTNERDPRIFIKVMGRKKDNYNLIDTLYCDKDDELLIADFTGDDYKKFSDVFEYKTIRIYTVPVTDTVLPDDELHEKAFDAIPKPRIKLYDKTEDNMGITVGVSIHPFSETQLIFTVVITESEGEKFVYRIEIEK